MKKNINIKKFMIAVMSIVMIFSTMTSCGQDVGQDEDSKSVSISESNSSEDDNIKIDINVSRENEDTSSTSDSSNGDSEATSSKKESGSSENDSSSKAESTTKKVDSSSSGDTSSKTTTKTSSNTTSKAVTQSTTRAATKATTKATTKSTTKATTPKTTTPSSSTTKPAGLTRLESAVWDISLDYGITFENYRSNKNLAIIREELIKYGQAFCKQRNAPKYVVNPKMYPYYDKNGKPLYAPCDMRGNTIAVGSMVEFPYDEHYGASGYNNVNDRLNDVRGFINGMYLYIERVICNSFRHGIENINWNITYGYEPAGICWTVMTGFPDDWK